MAKPKKGKDRKRRIQDGPEQAQPQIRLQDLARTTPTADAGLRLRERMLRLTERRERESARASRPSSFLEMARAQMQHVLTPELYQYPRVLEEDRMRGVWRLFVEDMRRHCSVLVWGVDDELLRLERMPPRYLADHLHARLGVHQMSVVDLRGRERMVMGADWGSADGDATVMLQWRRVPMARRLDAAIDPDARIEFNEAYLQAARERIARALMVDVSDLARDTATSVADANSTVCAAAQEGLTADALVRAIESGRQRQGMTREEFEAARLGTWADVPANPIRSPIQSGRGEDGRVELRVEASPTQAERDAANERAEAWLLEWLADAQKETWKKQRRFEVVVRGETYRITDEPNFNVGLIQGGKVTCKYCTQARGDWLWGMTRHEMYPRADVVLAQYLLLTTNPDEFFRVANVQRVDTPNRDMGRLTGDWAVDRVIETWRPERPASFARPYASMARAAENGLTGWMEFVPMMHDVTQAGNITYVNGVPAVEFRSVLNVAGPQYCAARFQNRDVLTDELEFNPVRDDVRMRHYPSGLDELFVFGYDTHPGSGRIEDNPVSGRARGFAQVYGFPIPTDVRGRIRTVRALYEFQRRGLNGTPAFQETAAPRYEQIRTR